MFNIVQLVRKIDIFSVPFSPAINDNQQFYHKSLMGGILSFIVLSLSAIYAIQQIMGWQFYELLPKVTQQYRIATQEEILQSHTIQIKIRNTGYNDDGSDTVDPFNPEAIVIQPVISYDVQDYYSYMNYEPYYYGQGELILSLQLINETQPVVTFVKCQEEYLFEGQKCASQEQVDLFNNQIGNQFYLEMQFNIINPNNFQLTTIRKTYSMLLEESFCTTETIYLQLSKYDLDKGAFLSTQELLYSYTDSDVQSQISSQQYCSKLWLPETVGVLWLIQQDQIKYEKLVYPKIGEVLAGIGSIVSVLFMIKYLMKEINTMSLKNQILDFLIGVYYPQIQHFEISKNWLDRVSSVKYLGKKVNIDSYLTFMTETRKKVQCKLNFLNLLYEISRIQIVLQSQYRRHTLSRSHKVGIKLKLDYTEDEVIIQKKENQEQLDLAQHNDIFDDYETFKDRDALLLSLQMMEKPAQEFELDQVNSDGQGSPSAGINFLLINSIR